MHRYRITYTRPGVILRPLTLHHYVTAPTLDAALDDWAAMRDEEYGHDSATTIRTVERNASREEWQPVDLAEAQR